MQSLTNTPNGVEYIDPLVARIYAEDGFDLLVILCGIDPERGTRLTSTFCDDTSRDNHVFTLCGLITNAFEHTLFHAASNEFVDVLEDFVHYVFVVYHTAVENSPLQRWAHLILFTAYLTYVATFAPMSSAFWPPEIPEAEIAKLVWRLRSVIQVLPSIDKMLETVEATVHTIENILAPILPRMPRRPPDDKLG